ncbi:hypothetical protein V1520DRAFT_348916 [Lipomyces starkeyi]
MSSIFVPEPPVVDSHVRGRPIPQAPVAPMSSIFVPEAPTPSIFVPEPPVVDSHVRERPIPQAPVPPTSSVLDSEAPEDPVPGPYVPKFSVPDPDVPDFKVPDPDVPDSLAPVSPVPDLHVPESPKANSRAPESPVANLHVLKLAFCHQFAIVEIRQRVTPEPLPPPEPPPRAPYTLICLLSYTCGILHLFPYVYSLLPLSHIRGASLDPVRTWRPRSPDLTYGMPCLILYTNRTTLFLLFFLLSCFVFVIPYSLDCMSFCYTRLYRTHTFFLFSERLQCL